MRKAVIIKTGDTFGEIASRLSDFEGWILAGLKMDMENIRVVDVTRGERLPGKHNADTGGNCNTGTVRGINQQLLIESILSVQRPVIFQVLHLDIGTLGF